MRRFALPSIVLVSLFASSAVRADAAQDSHKIRFAVHEEAATRTFTVMVGPHHACASASEKRAEHVLELKACASNDAQLDIEWFTRTGANEYRTTSTIPLAHGATTQLGIENGPWLEIAIQ